MLIIVEGPDGSGKSTLCKELKKYGYEIIRNERGQNLDILEICRLSFVDKQYVFDRALLTPWVYRIFDKQKLDDVDYSLRQILHILSLNTRIVYCTCKNAYNYSMLRGETNITTKYKATQIRRLYDFVIATIKLYTNTPIFEYDFEKSSVEDVIKFITN